MFRCQNSQVPKCLLGPKCYVKKERRETKWVFCLLLPALSFSKVKRVESGKKNSKRKVIIEFLREFEAELEFVVSIFNRTSLENGS